MKDFFDSIRLYIYDRVSSPFLGAFSIAWLGWNHKYLFILFSDLPVEYRFNLAHQLLYPNIAATAVRVVLLPTATAFVYVFGYPPIEKWIFNYWHERQRQLRVVRMRIDEETPLSKEEARKLRTEIASAEARYEEILSRQRDHIATLEAKISVPSIEAEDSRRVLQEKLRDTEIQLEALRTQIREKESGARSFDNLDEFSLRAVKTIAENSGRVLASEFRQSLNLAPVRVQHIVDILAEAQLIAAEDDSHGRRVLRLTPRGRELAVKKGFV